ncbi:MAG TPA: hypothetical protein VG204_15800, partial [Terriglobia bacterium]|nr:hypothetical protein [Terriglobia bacterium]
MKQGESVRRHRVLLVLATLAFFVVAPTLMAQIDTGSILGTISDQSGAVIPVYDDAGICQYENERTTPRAAGHAVKGARRAFISTLDSVPAVTIFLGT